jgi:outer membrane protein OmpA-like peptidoglycan-associated protein
MKFRSLISVAVLVALAGCQSVPKALEPSPAPVPTAVPTPSPTPTPVPTPAPVDPSSITAGNTGFSPRAQSPANTLAFSLHFGSPDKILSWKVLFVDGADREVPMVAGNPPDLPPSLSWDGKGSDGQLAPEGTYRARLSVDYGDPKGPTVVESAPFLLDITPPTGSISVSPQPWEPGDPDVLVNPPLVTFDLHLVPGAAPIVNWRLGVIHPDGRRFMDFISEDHKDNQVLWSGRAMNNAALERGTTYHLVAQVFDRYGNQGLVTGTLTVADQAPVGVETKATPPAQPAPVTVTLDGALLAETKIYFPAYSADLTKVDPAKAALNGAGLDQLADALRSVPQAKIQVTGHANKVYWQDAAKGEAEQKAVLIPLSLARAEAVRDALVRRGVEPGLFEVTGVGADGAVAAFGDLANNWKNRRVEFVLVP